jgi:Tfp pilus assembly protein PilO
MAFNYKSGFYQYKNYFLKVRERTQQPVYRVSLALLFTLTTISFFSLFALKPTLVTIASLYKEIQDGRMVDKALETKINSLNQTQKNYLAIKDDLGVVDLALPQQMEFDRFISEVHFLAFSHKVIISSFSSGEFTLTSADTPQNLLQIKLTVAGNFVDLKSFLKDLTNLDRLVKISSITMRNKAEVTGAKVQLDIDGEIFQLMPNKT